MTVKPSAKKDVEGAGGPVKYPKAVFFILGNEFCERFCYYGMRTVLTLYLTDVLRYSDSKATLVFHAFIMLAYFTPIFGAILADSWLGKFRTILYLSIVYAIGNVVLSVGSIPNSLSTMTAISLIGLFTIAIGTGGIKPCVSAFGGDQFHPSQESQRQKFFSIFYFAINSGSVLSTLLTPVLRADVHCFGSKSCYPLAYGIPASLMLVALFLFVIGKPLYKIQPPGGNIFGEVVKCIWHALIRKRIGTEKKRDHWLEYADDKFDKDFIKDIQSLLHVLWIFLPIPVFWALFDQTGSSWTLQATKMDGVVLGYDIKPDQMQVMNALMIIVMIPLFDYFVYPLFAKCQLLKKPLQRMAIGGFLSALAFVFAGFVELRLEGTYPAYPISGMSELTLINNSPCRINITGHTNISLLPFQSDVINNNLMNEVNTWNFNPIDCETEVSVTKKFNSTSQFETMMVTLQKGALEITKTNDTKARTHDGEPQFRILYSTDFEFFPDQNSSFKFINNKNKEMRIAPNNSTITSPTSGMTKYFKTAPGTYKVYSPFNATSHNSEPLGEFKLKSGGIYVLAIYKNSNMTLITRVAPNSLSILYQIPAYLILTAGEIMLSITGLEFSYSQAPQSMKSVVQAAWLLTVAVGNLIVMIIAKLDMFEKKSYELYMFAVLMALDMLVFSIMAYFYKYVSNDKKEDEQTSKKSTDTELSGKRNEAFEEETNFNK